MNVVDERGNVKQTTFVDLCIGDCFMDKDGDICIKTDQDSGIYTTDNRNWYSVRMDADEKVVPLEATLIIKEEK